MKYVRDKERRFLQILSLPIILSVFLPMVVFDIWVEFYHRICFKFYGLKYVKRSLYIKIDRQKLQYLKWYQKIGCAYCGYANGLASYWGSIAAETEKYWCAIMHKKSKNFKAPSHHKNFAPYGNKKALKKKYGLIKD